jgi:hypothetical protein
MRMGGITYKKCGKPNNLPCPKSPSMGAIWAGVNITCLAGICWLGRPLSFSMFWTSGPPFVCHSAVPGCSLLFSMFWTPWYHLFDRVKYMFDESMFFIIPHVLGCWVSIILHHSSSFLSFFQENDQTRMSMKPSL